MSTDKRVGGGLHLCRHVVSRYLNISVVNARMLDSVDLTMTSNRGSRGPSGFLQQSPTPVWNDAVKDIVVRRASKVRRSMVLLYSRNKNQCYIVNGRHQLQENALL